MKHLLLLTFIGLLLGLTSCKEDEEKGSLTLHFIPWYDEQTLQTLTVHPFENGQQIRFNLMSMLVSDLRLFDQSSEEILDDIEQVDISFDELQAAEDGYSMTIGDIPAGSYDGIRLGIGVPPDVNQKTPADFPSSSPLSKTGNYWVAWNSYIFMKTEGVLDSLGNGTFDLGFAMHTGSADFFRTLEGSLPLVIEDGQETELTIAIDYKKLLAGVDIKSHPQNHTPQDTSEIVKIINNLSSAFILLQ
jgi:hypothetical protein